MLMKKNINMTLKLILTILLSSFINSLSAEEISLQFSSTLNALAEYTEGDIDKPAVLILHGILQTHHFSTVQRVGDFLAESGYTTLRPTLTLEVDSRKKSLACEAIHTHSMDTDVEEIARWYQWLKQKSNRPIILIGHSAGASQLVVYQNKYKDIHEPPQKIIFISLAYFGNRPSSFALSEDVENARQAIISAQNGPATYGLSYCKKYVSIPEAFLSYMDWSEERITAGLKGITSPISLLFGGNDKRIPQQWPVKLKALGLKVEIIEGADHFFHGEQEFELLDFIEEAIGS